MVDTSIVLAAVTPAPGRLLPMRRVLPIIAAQPVSRGSKQISTAGVVPIPRIGENHVGEGKRQETQDCH